MNKTIFYSDKKVDLLYFFTGTSQFTYLKVDFQSKYCLFLFKNYIFKQLNSKTRMLNLKFKFFWLVSWIAF